jgi:hypothetical protein
MSMGWTIRYRVRRGRKWHQLSMIAATSADLTYTTTVEVDLRGGDPRTIEVLRTYPTNTPRPARLP